MIVDDLQKNGGLLTIADLRAYRTVRRKPIISTYREYELTVPSPPCSGGVHILQILHLLEDLSQLALQGQLRLCPGGLQHRARLLPGVLEKDLLEALREHVYKLKNEPESLPEHERYSLAGPAQELIDHPAISGILAAIIAPDPDENSYGFHFESSFAMIRSHGEQGAPAHCGPLAGSMAYRLINGQIWSGLTRVVWELSEVKKGGGGTPILSGSHKAGFPVPERFQQFDPAAYDEYACPAGSALIFSESCWPVSYTHLTLPTILLV